MNEAHLNKMKIHPSVLQRKLSGVSLGNICLLVMKRNFLICFLSLCFHTYHHTLGNIFFGAGTRQEQPCLYGTLECYSLLGISHESVDCPGYVVK